jgi:hypothetical protein
VKEKLCGDRVDDEDMVANPLSEGRRWLGFGREPHRADVTSERDAILPHHDGLYGVDWLLEFDKGDVRAAGPRPGRHQNASRPHTRGDEVAAIGGTNAQ